MYYWCFKARFENMFEMYEFGFHTGRFYHRAYFDACLFTWEGAQSCKSQQKLFNGFLRDQIWTALDSDVRGKSHYLDVIKPHLRSNITACFFSLFLPSSPSTEMQCFLNSIFLNS